jgi:hypothetical protein
MSQVATTFIYLIFNDSQKIEKCSSNKQYENNEKKTARCITNIEKIN